MGRCQWYGDKGGKGKCALLDVENNAGIALASTAGNASPQANSNAEDKSAAGRSPFSAPVVAAASIAAGFAIIAGAACFVRRHRAQKKRELTLASNAEQPPPEVDAIELA